MRTREWRDCRRGNRHAPSPWRSQVSAIPEYKELLWRGASTPATKGRPIRSRSRWEPPWPLELVRRARLTPPPPTELGRRRAGTDLGDLGRCKGQRPEESSIAQVAVTRAGPVQWFDTTTPRERPLRLDRLPRASEPGVCLRTSPPPVADPARIGNARSRRQIPPGPDGRWRARLRDAGSRPALV